MPNFSKNRLFLACTVALALSGCAIGPDYLRPSFSLPNSYFKAETASAPATEQSKIGATWWTLFQDPILNDLVEQGLTNNADILSLIHI